MMTIFKVLTIAMEKNAAFMNMFKFIKGIISPLKFPK